MTKPVSVDPPRELRRLDTPAARHLVRLGTAFEELQTVLRCCDRLVTELAAPGDEVDDLVVEATWTLALLCYARAFSAGASKPVLTDEDVIATHPKTDVLKWHRLLLQLPDSAPGAAGPRETLSVGVAQGADAKPEGVAITSIRQPLVDDITVRQTGAIVFGLCAALDQRIAAQHPAVLAEARELSWPALRRLPVLEVRPPA